MLTTGVGQLSKEKGHPQIFIQQDQLEALLELHFGMSDLARFSMFPLEQSEEKSFSMGCVTFLMYL